MSSIDSQMVPAMIPATASSQPGTRRTAVPKAIAFYTSQAVLAGVGLTLSAAIVPVAAIYSFIWLAQH